MDKNLVLIGLSGTGKSTVGELLAEELGMPFFDSDTLIEEREGKEIPRIFAEEGETYFRELESRVVKELSDMPHGAAVLSTGGGVVLREENVRLLRKSGVVVHLTAPSGVLVERLGSAGDRPLLKSMSPREARSKLDRMIKQRAPLYSRAAHLEVSTEGKSPAQVAEEIVRQPGRFFLSHP